MFKISDLDKNEPFTMFQDFFIKATDANQESIDAFLVASQDGDSVDARYVNLKYIIGDKFIFFSNYNSPKARQFYENSRVISLLFWSKINVQIRIRGKITKTSNNFNKEYFKTRKKEKNALAISSYQSRPINHYDEVKIKYKNVLDSENLEDCPSYWGGFQIEPDYFEFWEGKSFRLNKRTFFKRDNDFWEKGYLEP